MTGVLATLCHVTAVAGAACSRVPVLDVAAPGQVLFGTGWPAAPEPTGARNTENPLAFEGVDAATLAAVERGDAATLFKRSAYDSGGDRAAAARPWRVRTAPGADA